MVKTVPQQENGSVKADFSDIPGAVRELAAPRLQEIGHNVADNKRWFKIWTTILNDPHLFTMPLQDIARWFMLGALIAEHGTNGEIKTSKKQLVNLFRSDNDIDMKNSLTNMPNITWSNDNDNITVIMNKWSKYQVDSTTYERLKRYRKKVNDNGARREEKRREKKRSIFIQPSVEEVTAYCTERNNGIDGAYWVDFYQGKGWMVGKNKMKDWKATIRTWEKNNPKKEMIPDWRG